MNRICLLLGLLCSVAIAEPLKTPKTGVTRNVPFNPSNNPHNLPPMVAAQPLKITHHQPVGVEQEPPAISVTFNQPMVPVTSVGNLTGPAPIRVEPEVPGQWKWQGTTTLQLMPKERCAIVYSSYRMRLTKAFIKRINRRMV